MTVSISLIAELEEAVRSGSREKRVETLRRVTDLFLNDADRFNDGQIGLFDDVLLHLIKRVETKALIRLGEKLAPVDNAPPEVIRRLARDADIDVAAPVLSTSARLTNDDLVDIAQSNSQEHLVAISVRSRLDTCVTDVLIERGNREVVHTLATNPGAAFSELGFTALVDRAESDDRLTEKLGLRLDIPLRLLRQLLLKAAEAVRTRLLSVAPMAVREKIEGVLESIANEVEREAEAPRDYSQAQARTLSLQRNGQLNEQALLEFCREDKYEDMVSGLSLLCAAPLELIDQLMRQPRYDGLLVACRAAQLRWPTTAAILNGRFHHRSMAAGELIRAEGEFGKLTVATAQRAIRFWIVRKTTVVSGPGDTHGTEPM